MLARWDAAFRTRDRRVFDVEGRHPNIQSVRNVRAVYQYVTKDGDIRGEFNVHDSGKRSRDTVFGDACNAPDGEQFLRLIQDGCPRDFVIFHKQIETFAAKRFKPAEEEYKHPETSKPFVLPDDIARWVETEFPKVFICMSVYTLINLNPLNLCDLTLRKTDLGRLCLSDLVDSEKRYGRDLSELTFTLTDVGASTRCEKMQDTSYSTTSRTDTSQKDLSVDKDLLPLLESTGLQGSYNGEDLASFFATEIWIP